MARVLFMLSMGMWCHSSQRKVSDQVSGQQIWGGGLEGGREGGELEGGREVGRAGGREGSWREDGTGLPGTWRRTVCRGARR